MSTLTISDIGFTVVAPPQLLPLKLKLAKSKNGWPESETDVIWALRGVADTSQHVYFDHFRHWFHRVGATAAAAAKTEIDCNSKTAGRRAKRMKIWTLWGVLYISQHIFYDHFRH